MEAMRGPKWLQAALAAALDVAVLYVAVWWIGAALVEASTRPLVFSFLLSLAFLTVIVGGGHGLVWGLRQIR